jgi:hypothetical protein
MEIKKLFVGLILAFGLAAPAAHANDAQNMAGFYLAIKGIQVAALSGTADMWKALGHAQRAQETMAIAKDLEKGDLGPDVAQKAMKVASIQVRDQIEQLEAVGAPLTKEQRAAATAGYLKIAATTVLWAGAAYAGVKTLTSDQIDPFTKVALGIVMAKEVAEASKATGALLEAWRSYSRFNNGMRGLKEPSKELMKDAPMLAAL